MTRHEAVRPAHARATHCAAVVGAILACIAAPVAAQRTWPEPGPAPMFAIELGKGVYRVTDLVEKPAREDAPSDLAIIGRYILTPDIFPALHETAKDGSGEVQLTNGLRRLLRSRPIYAYEVDGVRHDTGNKLGFLKATVEFALARRDLAEFIASKGL